MTLLDDRIASIARVQRFAVATRITDRFTDSGIELVNPFGSLEAQVA